MLAPTSFIPTDPGIRTEPATIPTQGSRLGSDGELMKHIIFRLHENRNLPLLRDISVPILDALQTGATQSRLVDASRSFQISAHFQSQDFLPATDRSSWIGADGYLSYRPDTGPAWSREIEAWRQNDMMPPMRIGEAMQVECVYRTFMIVAAEFDAVLGMSHTPRTIQNCADLRLLAPPARYQILSGNLPLDPMTGYNLSDPFKANTFIFACRYDEVLVPATDGELEPWVPVIIMLARSGDSVMTDELRVKPITVLLSPNHYLLTAEGIFTGRIECDDVMKLFRFWKCFCDKSSDMNWFVSDNVLEAKWMIRRSGDGALYAVPYTGPSDGPVVGRTLPSDSVKVECVGAFKFGIQCSICLDDYDDGDFVTQLPCNHTGHLACLKPWCAETKKCPFCRKDIIEPEPVAESVASSDSNSTPPIVPRPNAAMILNWLIAGGGAGGFGTDPVTGDPTTVAAMQRMWEGFVASSTASNESSLQASVTGNVEQPFSDPPSITVSILVPSWRIWEAPPSVDGDVDMDNSGQY